MPDLAYLSGLEREFYATRKEYLDQIEITTRLLNAAGAYDLETVKRQWDREVMALRRYQEARSELQKALSALCSNDERRKAA